MKRIILPFLLLLSAPALAQHEPVTNDTFLSPALPKPLNSISGIVRDVAVAHSVNMQTTGADFTFEMMAVPATWRPMFAFMKNCTGTAATAVGGIFTATGGGGTAIVAGTQTYTGTDQALTLAVTSDITAQQLYFRLTVGSTGAATCDIVVVGKGEF